MTVTLEICVDSPAGLEAAVKGGADRIELCSALDLGGLTPTPGLIALAAQMPVPSYAMIRPRGGNFHFSVLDEQVMLAEIDAVRDAGLAGIVIGAALPDHSLDLPLLGRLKARAGPLAVTLHRVFDLVPDKDEALEQAIDLGFERILTSGGALKAVAGAELLRHLVARAKGRISIMPGSGVTPDNAADLLRLTGAHEIHASCREVVATKNDKYVEFGFAADHAMETSQARVRQLRDLLKN